MKRVGENVFLYAADVKMILIFFLIAILNATSTKELVLDHDECMTICFSPMDVKTETFTETCTSLPVITVSVTNTDTVVNTMTSVTTLFQTSTESVVIVVETSTLIETAIETETSTAIESDVAPFVFFPIIPDEPSSSMTTEEVVLVTSTVTVEEEVDSTTLESSSQVNNPCSTATLDSN